MKIDSKLIQTGNPGCGQGQDLLDVVAKNETLSFSVITRQGLFQKLLVLLTCSLAGLFSYSFSSVPFSAAKGICLLCANISSSTFNPIFLLREIWKKVEKTHRSLLYKVD